MKTNLFATGIISFTVLITIVFSAQLVAQEIRPANKQQSETSLKHNDAAPAAQQSEEEQATDDEVQALYDRLAKYLTGTKWTGQFTISNKEMGELTQEEYYILSAEKMEEGDYWKLVARIKYGKNDLTMPLPLEIKWADETPVITVNKMLVPTLGTFDARVLIRNGKYSGTWSHDEVGGHLFGEIKKLSEEELAELLEAQE